MKYKYQTVGTFVNTFPDRTRIISIIQNYGDYTEDTFITVDMQEMFAEWYNDVNC